VKGSNPGRSYEVNLSVKSLYYVETVRDRSCAKSSELFWRFCKAGIARGRSPIDETRKTIIIADLFHSLRRLENRSMIGRCAGGHRKSRRTAGAIHRRNICGRLQPRGSFAATNTGEIVLIGTHGGELVIASGVSYLLAGKNFLIWSVMACVEAPTANTRPTRGKAG
jgi:hypothetical protein